jgi:Na+/melibiose symporter-like transporter
VSRAALSPLRLAAFSAAGLPVGALIVSLAVYLPHYYTSALGMPLAAVGAAFALVRLLDICFDPVLGVTMDRTRTRIGRFRPWLFASVPVLMIAMAAAYIPPRAVSAAYLVGWLLVLYAGYSILLLAQLSWGALIVEEYHARSRIYGWIQVVTGLGALAILLLPAIVHAMWPEVTMAGVPMMGWFLIALVPVTVGLTSTTREPARETRKQDRTRLRDYWQVIRRPNMLRVLAADMFTTLGPALTAPLYLFFFEEARGYTAVEANWLLMLYIGAGFVGPVFWARMAVRLSKHGAIMAGAVAYTVAQTILLILPAAHPAEMAVAMFTVGFIASGFPLVVRAMIADIADEVLLDTGRDRTALLYSITTSVAKVGSTLSVGIAYSILPLFGFVAAAGAVNTPEAIWGLEACYLVPPVLCVMIGGLAMWGYTLDARRHGEIRAALDAAAQKAIAADAIASADFSGNRSDPRPVPGE